MKILKVENIAKEECFFDNQEFKEFMFSRINKTLLESVEYNELQADAERAIECKDYDSYIEITNDLLIKTEDIMYLRGWKDAVKMLSGSLR